MNDSLPYYLIARWNGLEKELPDDANSFVWIDKTGNRYIETNLGFVSALQYNWKLQCDKTQSELEAASAEHLELKRRHANLVNDNVLLKKKIDSLSGKLPSDNPNDKIGGGTRRTLKSIIKASLTPEEKIEEISRYLNR